MKIHFYGNATFIIEHNKTRILCDPWFGGTTVGGTWDQFPPFKKTNINHYNIDYIYISHIHDDHCQSATLDKLNKKIPIIILDKKPNYLFKMLLNKKFKKIIKVKPKIKKQIKKNFIVELFDSTSNNITSTVIDSSIMFKINDKFVLNCNDNMPDMRFAKYISQKYKKIDIAFLPYSGAGAYPAMYNNLNDKQKKYIIKKVLQHDFNIFKNCCEKMNLTNVVPVAGGYSIRGINYKVNFFQPRPLDDYDLVKYCNQFSRFNSNVILLQSGLVYDVNKNKILYGKYKKYTKKDLEIYFKKMSKKNIERKINFSKINPNIFRLISNARMNMWKKQKDIGFFPNYSIILDIKEDTIKY